MLYDNKYEKDKGADLKGFGATIGGLSTTEKWFN